VTIISQFKIKVWLISNHPNSRSRDQTNCRFLSISKCDCSNTTNRRFLPNSQKYFIKLLVLLHSFFHFVTLFLLPAIHTQK
jgi:hypothetical protein